MEGLTGKQLAAKAKDCIDKGLGLSATAIECNYFTTAQDKKIPATAVFQRELLSALGYQFNSRGGGLSDTVSVNKVGTAVIAPSRVAAAGFKPGDELEIIHNPSIGGFVLKKVEPTVKDDW